MCKVHTCAVSWVTTVRVNRFPRTVLPTIRRDGVVTCSLDCDCAVSTDDKTSRVFPVTQSTINCLNIENYTVNNEVILFINEYQTILTFFKYIYNYVFKYLADHSNSLNLNTMYSVILKTVFDFVLIYRLCILQYLITD